MRTSRHSLASRGPVGAERLRSRGGRPSLAPPRYGVSAADQASPSVRLSGPESGSEREADRAAENVVRGKLSGPLGASRSEPFVDDLPVSVPRTAGQKLDSSARHFFERRFGADFSKVRIHSGSGAAASAGSIGARAYTRGHDIVFGAGEYQPSSPGGRALIAHELAHHVQQSRSGEAWVQPKLKVGAGLTLDTKGFTTTKSGSVYSAPKAVRKSSLLNEVFSALLASPRTFELAGSTSAEVNTNLDDHIKARMGVVDFASKKKYGFGAGAGFKMNPDYWEVTAKDFKLKKGADADEALRDINNPKHVGDPKHEYMLGCFAATVLTMIGGAQAAAIDEKSSADPDDWIPGDWGYIKNVKFPKTGGKDGLEGENLIYVGKDLFWGHFKPGLEYHKLSEWIDEVNHFEPPTEAELQSVRRFTKVGLV